MTRELDRGRNQCDLSYEFLYQMYWKERKCIRIIGEETGWSQNIIWRRMKKLGIPRRDLSEAFRGRKHTQNAREKMSKSMKLWHKEHPDARKGPKNPFYGKSVSPENRAKMAARLRGKPAWNRGLTKETDERVRESADKLSKTRKRMFADNQLVSPTQNKPRSDEAKRKMSETRKRLYASGELVHPWSGRKHSEESKRKMSETHKRMYAEGEVAPRIFKAVVYPTAPEKEFIKINEDLNLHYVYNGDCGIFQIDGRIPDFYDIETKTIVEIFGRPFHDPDNTWIENIPYVRTEQGTREFYKERDWGCIIIWDDEIDNEDLVLTKLGVSQL